MSLFSWRLRRVEKGSVYVDKNDDEKQDEKPLKL